MKVLLCFVAIFFNPSCNLFCQTKVITGRVISEYYELLPAVSIYIKDTVEVGRTDGDGFFLTNIPDTEKVLKFIVIGMEPATIELNEGCSQIELIMMVAFSYDFITLKRADRLREIRYKKLPEIHKEAFKTSIFKTENVCYNRYFKFYKENKR